MRSHKTISLLLSSIRLISISMKKGSAHRWDYDEFICSFIIRQLALVLQKKFGTTYEVIKNKRKVIIIKNNLKYFSFNTQFLNNPETKIWWKFLYYSEYNLNNIKKINRPNWWSQVNSLWGSSVEPIAYQIHASQWAIKAKVAMSRSNTAAPYSE